MSNAYYDNAVYGTFASKPRQVGVIESSVDQASVGMSRWMTGMRVLAHSAGFGDDESVLKAIQNQRETEKFGKVTEGFTKLMESEGVIDTLGALLQDPIGSVIPLSAGSLPSFIPGAAAGVSAGLITKNPQIGLSAASLASGLGFETPVDYVQRLEQSISESGGDPDDIEAWRAVINDSDTVRDAQAKAGIKGATIAAVGMAFAPIAGKTYGMATRGLRGNVKIGPLGVTINRAAKNEIGIAETIGRKVGGAVGDVGVQMVGESAGELISQVAADDDIDWKGVMLEGVASLGFSAAESGVGMMSGTKKAEINKSDLGKISESALQDLRKTAPKTAEAVENIAGKDAPSSDPFSAESISQYDTGLLEQAYSKFYDQSNNKEKSALPQSDLLVASKIEKELQNRYEKSILSADNTFSFSSDENTGVLQVKRDIVSKLTQNADIVNSPVSAGSEETRGEALKIIETYLDSFLKGKEISGAPPTQTSELVKGPTRGEYIPPDITDKKISASAKITEGDDASLARDVAKAAGEGFFTEEEIQTISEKADESEFGSTEKKKEIDNILSKIANNDGTPEDIAVTEILGLTRLVEGRVVITEKGLKQMETSGLKKPALSESERESQILEQIDAEEKGKYGFSIGDEFNTPKGRAIIVDILPKTNEVNVKLEEGNAPLRFPISSLTPVKTKTKASTTEKRKKAEVKKNDLVSNIPDGYLVSYQGERGIISTDNGERIIQTKSGNYIVGNGETLRVVRKGNNLAPSQEVADTEVVDTEVVDTEVTPIDEASSSQIRSILEGANERIKAFQDKSGLSFEKIQEMGASVKENPENAKSFKQEELNSVADSIIEIEKLIEDTEKSLNSLPDTEQGNAAKSALLEETNDLYNAFILMDSILEASELTRPNIDAVETAIQSIRTFMRGIETAVEVDQNADIIPDAKIQRRKATAKMDLESSLGTAEESDISVDLVKDFAIKRKPKSREKNTPVVKKDVNTPVVTPLEEMNEDQLSEFITKAKQNVKNLSERNRAREQNNIDDASLFLKKLVGKNSFERIIKQAELTESLEEYTPTAEEAAEFAEEDILGSAAATEESKTVEQTIAEINMGDILSPENLNKFNGLSEEQQSAVRNALKPQDISGETTAAFLDAKEKESLTTLTEIEKNHINELISTGVFDGSFLDNIANSLNKSDNVLQRVFGAVLGKEIKNGWDSGVSIKVGRYDKVKAYGAYDTRSKKIYINLSRISPKGTLDTLAHEVIHSMASEKIEKALSGNASEQDKDAIKNIKDAILATRAYALKGNISLSGRVKNALGDLTSGEVSNRTVQEFATDILTLQDLQILVSEVKSNAAGITSGKGKENLLSKVFRKILEVVTGRKIANDSPLMRAFNDSYYFVRSTPYEKGKMDAQKIDEFKNESKNTKAANKIETGQTEFLESRVLETISEASDYIAQTRIGRFTVGTKEYNTGYKATGWFGAGYFNKAVQDIAMKMPRLINSYTRGVETNAKRIKEVVKKYNLNENVVTTAMGNIENNISREQEAKIKEIGKASFNTAVNKYAESLVVKDKKNPASLYDAEAVTEKQYEKIKNAKDKLKALYSALTTKQYKRVLKAATQEEQKAVDAATAEELVKNRQNFTLRQTQAFNSLPEEAQKVVADAREQIDWVINKAASSSESPATFLQGEGSYLNRAYEIFDNPKFEKEIRKNEVVIESSKKVIREHLQQKRAEALVKAARKNGQDLDYSDAYMTAESLVKDEEITIVLEDLLNYGKSRESYAQEGSGFKLAQGFLKRRGVMDKEIQALLGVYTAPDNNFVRTALKLATWASKSETLKSMEVEGAKEGWLHSYKKPGYVMIPESKTYGALAGKYVPSEFLEGIKTFVENQDQLPAWLKVMMKATGMSMYSKTVLSAVTQVRNFWSNFALTAAGGYLNNPAEFASEFRKSFAVIKERFGTDILGKDQGKYEDFIKMMIEEGVLDNQVDTQLMKELLMTDSITSDNFLESLLKNQSKIIKGVKKGLDVAQFSYSNVDGLFKIAVWAIEKQRGIEVRGLNDEQSTIYAARIVRDVMPTYSNIPVIIKELKRFPFIAPFVSFTSEMVRTTYNITRIGIEEIREGNATGNAELAKIGVQRLAALGATVALPGLLATGIAMAHGIDSDDDMAVRRFLPDWQKNSLLIYLGKPKDGKVNFVDLSFLMPHNTLVEPFSAAYNSLRDPENTDNILLSSAASFVAAAASPYASPQILSQALIEISMNRTSSGAQVFNPTASNNEKVLRVISHVWNAFEPGTVSSLERIKSAANGVVTDSGRTYSLGNEIMSLALGQRIAEVDALQGMRFKANNFMSSNREASSMFTRSFLSSGTRTQDDIINDYGRAQNARINVANKLRGDIRAAVSMGVKESTVSRSLTDAGVPKETTTQILTGRLKSLTPSTSQIQTARRIDPNRITAYRAAKAARPDVYNLE